MTEPIPPVSSMPSIQPIEEELPTKVTAQVSGSSRVSSIDDLRTRFPDLYKQTLKYFSTAIFSQMQSTQRKMEQRRKEQNGW